MNANELQGSRHAGAAGAVEQGWTGFVLLVPHQDFWETNWCFVKEKLPWAPQLISWALERTAGKTRFLSFNLD